MVNAHRVYFTLMGAVFLGAQTTTVEVRGKTPTQAVIHVTAVNADGSPYAGACTYRISEGTSFATLVNDVNPALFPGSNQDSRPGSLKINGRERFFVAGSRVAARASDQKFYSRALQADTDHWVGVTCGAVAERSTTFHTQNPPMGTTYPEFPQFDAASFGNRATPTIDFLDKTKTYIDPLSGVLLKRISGPLEQTFTNQQGPLFSFVRDVNGNGWSNPSNAITSQNPATLASTSTANAPLFLAWPGLDSSNSFDIHATTNDIQLAAYCGGAAGATLQACISLDSGGSCATDSIDISCPVSPGVVSAPANYPAPMFQGWGLQRQTLTKTMLSNSPNPTVSVSGNQVTWTGGYAKFYAERAAGSKIMIPGTAPGCPGNLCTVQSVDNTTQITIQENVPGTVTATAQDYGAGVRVWLKSGSPAVSASFTFNHHYSEQFFGASNAEFDTCSGQTITDIATDAQGNLLPSPLSGYLCTFSGLSLVLFIPSTGESRLLSTFWQQGVGRMQVPNNPFSGTDSKTLFATNSGNQHLYKATLVNPAGVYREYQPGLTEPKAPDQLVWTDLTNTSTPIDQQLAAYGGPAQAGYATGLFSPLRFVGVIGGYVVYDASTGGDTPCIKVRALAETNQIVQAFDSWDTAPLRWGGCHTAPIGTGPLLNLTMNPIQRFDSTVPLSGPFNLRILQMRRANGAWSSFNVNVTGATNANPVVINAPANSIDPYYGRNFGTGPGKGVMVTVSGGTGAWAAVNGSWRANVSLSTPDSFTIPVDSTSFGPLTGTLVATTSPALIHSIVSSITSGSPAIVLIQVALPNIPQNHRLQDGDPIGFGNLSNQTQYYAKTAGFTANTFAVYSDPQMTQPVNGSALAGASGGAVYFAETCPTGLPASLTTGMTFDSLGAVGVRCFTVRVEGEPCSSFATAAEHAKLPCKSDPSNTSKSSLQDMQVGDAIRDITRGAYDETFVLVKKIKNSETDIEATFMRWYGNKIQGGDGHVANFIGNLHDAGWTPIMVPSNSHSSATGWMDATDATTTFISSDPTFGQAHGDFGYGNAPGLVTYAGGGADHILNKPIRDLLNTPLTFTKRENPPWADSPGSQLSYNSLQSYPGHRQLHASQPEFRWKGDWGALNPSYGSGQTEASGLFSGVVTTNIRGTSYDSGSTTSLVFKINNSVGAFDRKRTPTYAWAGKYMFRDKSGPGSLITDADLWNYCVADQPGECRPGSALNDVFLVGRGFSDTGGYCLTNTLNITSPCFIGLNGLGGWAEQMEIDPVDTTARRIRRLTQGLTAPGMHWTFTTWLQSPDGKWGFFSTPYVNGFRNEYFAMKLPSWPAAQSRDSQNRGTFIPLPRAVKQSPGAAFARARFGYAENGPPSNFYCTSRAEGCSTEIPSASPNDPYSFVSEAATHLACDTGCVVKIPAIPGRVVYFVIEYLNSAGNLISKDPIMEAIAVP